MLFSALEFSDNFFLIDFQLLIGQKFLAYLLGQKLETCI